MASHCSWTLRCESKILSVASDKTLTTGPDSLSVAGFHSWSGFNNNAACNLPAVPNSSPHLKRAKNYVMKSRGLSILRASSLSFSVISVETCP